MFFFFLGRSRFVSSSVSAAEDRFSIRLRIASLPLYSASRARGRRYGEVEGRDRARAFWLCVDAQRGEKVPEKAAQSFSFPFPRAEGGGGGGSSLTKNYSRIKSITLSGAEEGNRCEQNPRFGALTHSVTFIVLEDARLTPMSDPPLPHVDRPPELPSLRCPFP